MTKLNHATAMGAMRILLNEELVDASRSLGCTEQEWELLTGNRIWTGRDRPTIKRLLDNLLQGMLHTMGLPPIDLPAEYVASCVCLFIHPANFFPACSWLGNFHRSDELGNFDGSQMNPTDGLERVSASQIFALVCTLYSNEHVHIIARRFADKFGVQLGILNGGNISEETSNKKKSVSA